MKNFFVTGLAAILIFGMFTVSAFAATNTEKPMHDMGTMTGHDMDSMTNDSHAGHEMESVRPDSHNEHDMNNMAHDGHGNNKAVENDNPWPVLYGFGGAILAVITVAGIIKFSSKKG